MEELHSGEVEIEGDELRRRGAARLGSGRGGRGGGRVATPSRKTRAPRAASGSSTPRVPARRSPRWASSRPRAPGGILILTHRRNLVDQFLGELRDRGYRKRISPPLLKNGGGEPPAGGPVTVETYQWFVRNAGKVSDAYTIVICDEAHTALGEKTSASIRQWIGPVFIGMTATGALIARHVTDLFPTQTSRFDLAQAARRGVIAPLRCVRIPPGVGVRSIANVPLRRGEVDQDFDQEELAALLDQTPFNLAVADLYKTRFKDLPGRRLLGRRQARAQRREGLPGRRDEGEGRLGRDAQARADAHPGRLRARRDRRARATRSCSPRAGTRRGRRSACTWRRRPRSASTSSASGRVTRRTPGKEAGIVVDFVHPATPNDDPVVTLHSLLDRDVYRGGAIVVGPVRRGRGRRLRVERRVVPVTADPERRAQVFERELWRIAVEHLSWGEQQAWATLAGARVASNNWRRAKAMLHFDSTGELRRAVPAHLPAAQPQHAAAPARAGRGRQPARRRGVRRRRRDRRRLVARRAPRGREGAAPGAGRAADRPPRPGRALALAPGRVLARGARGVRGAALAGDEAAARPARELGRRGARAQRAPAGAGGAQAGPAAVGGAAGGGAGAHARGPAGAATAPACGWRASRARWPASCCATSRRASAAAAAAAGRRRAPATSNGVGATRSGGEGGGDAANGGRTTQEPTPGGRRRTGRRRRAAARRRPTRRPPDRDDDAADDATSDRTRRPLSGRAAGTAAHSAQGVAPASASAAGAPRRRRG